MEELTGCTDFSIAEKISDYAMDELSLQERKKVEAYLKICSYCSKLPILKCVEPKVGYWIKYILLGEEVEEGMVDKCVQHVKICDSCREQAKNDAKVAKFFKQVWKYQETQDDY